MQSQIKHTLIKGRSKNASDSDIQEMITLFHQPEIEYELKNELFNELMSSNRTMKSPLDIKMEFTQLWLKIEKRKPRRNNKRLINTILQIAAIWILGLLVGIFFKPQKASNIEPVYYATHSPKGSISEMILPDGSVIYLNSDSRIEYSMEGNKKGIREVFLTGEAWFDVAKNKKKPFIVHTPVYDVTVTGTQFNVKSYLSDEEITTTLEKGQVVINSNNKFKLKEDVVLKPGEQVVLNKVSRELTIKEVNTKWFTSWKDNKLIFVNMKLKDLEVLLERKYGVDIEVKNKDILNLHFDGTIKNESILEILEVIKKALPINYKIVGQHIEITN